MDSNIAEYHISVVRSPREWEIGIYVTGALVLLGIAALNLWKLWKSGNYPAPSPFPNYDYRYLEKKYGTTYSDIKHKRGGASNFSKTLERKSPAHKPSLKMDDTFENINELGTLELMSKDLDLGPLKKSVSTDSLSSISSIGNSFGQDFIVGQVEVNMEYDLYSSTLHVTLLQGKDLMEKEDVHFESCFVRISLLPDEQIVGISRMMSCRCALGKQVHKQYAGDLEGAIYELKNSGESALQSLIPAVGGPGTLPPKNGVFQGVPAYFNPWTFMPLKAPFIETCYTQELPKSHSSLWSRACIPLMSGCTTGSIQRSAFSVLFDEKFSIPLDQSALEENSLRFSVFGIDEDERNISTGVAELKLLDLDLASRPFSAWLYLQDMNKAVDSVGEILLSLSYLPTAERLTVVVVKARNLVWTNGKTTADPFVKVYLLQDGRKISKKKTAVKRDDTNPVFNEAMIFSVPAIVLQDLSLRVTVAECCEDGRAENIGHVIIGPSTNGLGITHWNQMLATLRKPVSMWHPVRRN